MTLPNGIAALLAPNQIRAARALLGWSGPALAAAAGVSLSTVRRLEEGTHVTSPLAWRAIEAALDAAGVRFVPGGAVMGQANASA